MLESFSVQAVGIIEKAKETALSLNSEVVGSEHLLIAMYQTKDSICHFLFKELNIKEEDIMASLDKMEVIHKVNNKTIFTKKFIEIIENAKVIKEEVKSDYVYDEHLFYSLLELRDSVAYEIVNNLNIDIEEMLFDIEEIFNFYDKEDEEKDPFPFLRLIKSDNSNHPYIKRKDYLEQIIYILRKKQKNNPLLIGNAGVGKTSIIEGLSKVLKGESIYELDLGSVVAGTKYRGELEEKLLKALNFLKEKKAIVFIDEIHNIVGAGSNDGSLDIANILKPYLTKPNIKVIGATTLDEYYMFLSKDKALSRRFQNIFIDEPSKEETFIILSKIKKYYEEYHNVKYSNKVIKDIVNKCELYIPNRFFPDKAIDVLDEVGAITNFYKGSNMLSYVDKVIYSMNGIKPKKKEEIYKLKLSFKELIPYYINFIERKKNVRNIVTIGVNKGFKIETLLKDIYKVFSVKSECFLEVDMESFQDITSLSNLVGSNKGYVGYEQGGLLYEHILKYPLSIIYFKDFQKAHHLVTNFVTRLVKKTYTQDNKGRKIFFNNTIFIIEQPTLKKEHLGFDNTKNRNEITFCDVVLEDKVKV